MKHFLPVVSALFSTVAAVNAATYTTNFNNFGPLGSDVAGQDSWVINDAADQFSQVAKSNVNPLTPFTQSNVLNLGDASAVGTQPTGSSVVLSHGYSETVGQTTVGFDFLIVDSGDGAFANRDQFGVSLSNGGANLFAITFNPSTQSSTPDSTQATWNISYQVGNGPSIGLNLGVLELSQYHFDLAFAPSFSSPGMTDFLLTITSSVPNTLFDGVAAINLDPSVIPDAFNVSWSKVGSTFGSNSILIDNLSVVPEVSSSALLGVAGIAALIRRRRA